MSVLNKTKLHKETRTDKRGKIVTKWVKNNDDKTSTKPAAKKPAVKKEPKEKPWWDFLKELNLNRYPVGVDKADVTIHVDLKDKEDCNSKAVATWTDKKTGKQVRVYTREFLHRNAQKKWQRIEDITKDDIDKIKSLSKKGLSDKIDKIAQASAILMIIAETGLRVGQTAGLKETGNKGVSTIAPDDITISKNGDISLNFIGKSYKENTALIQNQPELAKYLRSLKSKMKGQERLFEIDRTFVDKVFKNKFGYKDLKIKDMRTYVATDLAREYLFKDVKEFKQTLTGEPKKDVKSIKDKLKSVYEYVSDKLNNTPKMAETSYVHPAVRLAWIEYLGYDENSLMKSDITSLDYIIANTSFSAKDVHIDEGFEEDCDEYNLFSWEYDDLEKGHLNSGKGKFAKLVDVHKKDGTTYKAIRHVGSDKNYTPKHFKHLEQQFGSKVGNYKRWLTSLFPTNYHKGKSVYFDSNGGEFVLKPIEVAYRNSLMKEKYKGKLDELQQEHSNARAKYLDRLWSNKDTSDENLMKEGKKKTLGSSRQVLVQNLQQHPYEKEVGNFEHTKSKTKEDAHVEAGGTEIADKVAKKKAFEAKYGNYIKYKEQKKDIEDTINNFDFTNKDLNQVVTELELLRKKNRIVMEGGSKALFLLDNDTKLNVQVGDAKGERTYGQLIQFLKQKRDDVKSGKRLGIDMKLNISYNDEDFKHLINE